MQKLGTFGLLALILASGLAMVSTGVAVGLVLSTLVARGMNSLLFGIGSFDGPSFLGISALLILVAMVACWISARRAMRVDPLIALRYD